MSETVDRLSYGVVERFQSVDGRHQRKTISTLTNTWATCDGFGAPVDASRLCQPGESRSRAW
jgi:hypothetical protein